jgi:hypothetical protein
MQVVVVTCGPRTICRVQKRNYRGAYTNINHLLLSSKYKQKKIQRGGRAKGDKKKNLHVEKFKESNTAVTYEERIQKKLSRGEDSVEEKWTNIKNAIIRTADCSRPGNK